MAKQKKLASHDEIVERKLTNCPLTFVRTAEEYRAFTECRGALLKMKSCKTIYRWDVTGTLVDTVNPKQSTAAHADIEDLVNWYATLPTEESDSEITQGGERKIDNSRLSTTAYDINVGPLSSSALFIMDLTANMHDSDNTGHTNPLYARAIKNSLDTLVNQERSIFILSHTTQIPKELEHYCEYIEYQLPGIEQISSYVRQTTNMQINASGGRKIPQIKLTEDEEMKIAQELLGLTMTEIDEALATSNRRNATQFLKEEVDERGFDLSVIREMKARSVERSGTMKVISSPGGLELVGGSHALKEELSQIRMDTTSDSRNDGVPAPKGFLMVGPGGVGKTLTVKCMGEYLNTQVVSLDIGSCKGGLVGLSEQNLRDSLDLANHISPVILLVDEFEKMWAGSNTNSSGGSDGGTSANMLQTWLRWMQDEKDDGVIVVACCNDISGIPGPVIRSGRFDDIIYVPLPGPIARREVFEIHLKMKGWNLETLNDPEGLMEELLDRTKGFSGAEIERVVVKSIRNKIKRIGAGRDKLPELEDFVLAIDKTTPLCCSHAEELVYLDRWTKERHVIEASNEPLDFQLDSIGTSRKIGAAKSASKSATPGNYDSGVGGARQVGVIDEGNDEVKNSDETY